MSGAGLPPALMLHIYEGDDDGADMMLLIYSLKVVGAQRGSVLIFCSALIWSRFAAFCINSVPFCCVLH